MRIRIEDNSMRTPNRRMSLIVGVFCFLFLSCGSPRQREGLRVTPHSGAGKTHEAMVDSPNELSGQEIMRLVHDLEPWPVGTDQVDLTLSGWKRLLSTARIVQDQDSALVEWALNSYCIHYDTSFEDDVDASAEWSKPLLLL